ncbi:MAG: HAMP domain-containing histidine kinase, partial [Planctomycetales bacterium]|nr:HAMP domain-containing histidine kinase [Planctomycetales bacterium]
STTQDPTAGRLIVQVMRPRTSLDEEKSEYLAAVMLAGSLAIVASCFAGYLLAKRILSPISAMTREAERISAERLSQRLPLTNPSDEFGRLALTLNQLFDRIEHAMDRMKRFTANAAHELRSPIAIMRTEAEVALQATRSGEDWRRVVEIMFGETVRLGELVDQLLELSRHDAGLDAIADDPRESVPIHALLADVVATFQLPAAQKNVQITLKDVPPWETPGDDVRLGRLFHNLVDNALKYTPPSGRIEIQATLVSAGLQIEFCDSGPGIPPEYLHMVFERFFRVDSARNRQAGGTGLGLAICRAIVEAHHGTIEARNHVTGGACFVVTLPGHPSDDTVV